MVGGARHPGTKEAFCVCLRARLRVYVGVGARAFVCCVLCVCV